MLPRYTLFLLLLCTIVFNVYLVWLMDSLQRQDGGISGSSSVWIEEDIMLLYDVDKSKERARQSLGQTDADQSRLFNRITKLDSASVRGCPDEPSAEVVDYLAYIRKIEHNSSGAPEWARLLAIPSVGYHSFNTTASDRLGNQRETLPDTRDPECLALNYNDILSTSASVSVSVVIVFHNEARSTLLRTIHGVLLRTPDILLSEVILVDDASTFLWLLEALEDFVQRLPKTRLLRLARRRGLIRARLAGAKTSTGDVLVFLDAHTEVNTGWLEPLLYRIHKNRKTVAVPQMDVIDWSSFSYQRAAELHYGTFAWDLNFQYRKYPRRLVASRKNATDPIPTPVMVGCAHAVDRNYFFSSGSYDVGMKIWGGENIEHSFRVWMCGGRVEILPCSRVGHVFKPKLPYSFEGNSLEIIQGNLIRTAEVWMDEYSTYFYATQSFTTPVEMRSLAKRKHMRSKMKCRNFGWYLANVIPDLPVPRTDMVYFGQLSSVWRPDLCVQPDYSTGRLGVIRCTDQELSEQFFYLDVARRLMFREFCTDVTLNNDRSTLGIADCPANPRMQWYHSKQSDVKMIYENSSRCLTLDGDVITMDLCSKNKTQFWEFSYGFDFQRDWDLQTVLEERLRPPRGAVLFGWLRHIASHYCLSVRDHSDHVMVPCDEQPEFEQIIHLDKDERLRYRNLCLAAAMQRNSTQMNVDIIQCEQSDINRQMRWEYNSQTRQLKLKHTEYCLFAVREPPQIEPFRPYLTGCDKNAIEQKWRFKYKL